MFAVDRLLVRLHHVQRARLAALPADVHDHERVVAAHHLVGEVEPARAGVHHRHAGGHSRGGQAPRHLAAESVVAQPGVTDAGHQDAHLALGLMTRSPPPRVRRRTADRLVSRISSWPGSPSIVTPRCILPSKSTKIRSIVAERPSSSRACRSASGAGRRRTWSPCRKRTPSTTASVWPALGSARPGGGCGGESARGRGHASSRGRAGGRCPRGSRRPPAAPCRGRPDRRPRSPRAPHRTATARAGAAPPRSRSSRTGRRGSRARSAGWSGSTIAAPNTTSSASVASTGIGVHAGAAAAPSGEMKRPPEARSSGCVEISDRASAPARSRPVGARRSGSRPAARPRSCRRPARAPTAAARPPSAPSPADAVSRSIGARRAASESPAARSAGPRPVPVARGARKRTSASSVASGRAVEHAAQLEVVERASQRRAA